MTTPQIRARPPTNVAITLLKRHSLPAADLRDAHMESFFFAGSKTELTGLVGLEFCGADALLRSLVVATEARGSGLGAALVAHAESYARDRGARSVYLLTTTAEDFFARLGYVRADREAAPLPIRETREFSELCPASSSFMVKQL
jgi:amino-acid N-acetyltransferase